MANALKTLFADIAESIRGGLPDEGLMKPNVFPSKIDEIVALLENAGSGEGGTGSSGSVGNLKFASGSYNVGTNRNRATVTHGFNTMPDLIIVWYTGFYGGTKEEYIEEFPLELAWGMKSKFSSQTLSGYVIPGFGVSANSGINNYTDSIGIYCPDQYTFQFGSSANDGGGRLLTGARYNWLAISGMGGAIGGVDSDLVKYVTFIGADGKEFCEKMPVLNGDDCKNPITHWNLSEPTKESTAQYNYTYSGWSLTEGGSADANALKAVTEDKTVYAAFAESVRKYTVRFFDGDTLLTTKQVEYGGSATHTTTKENYILSGWNPEPSNVTEDMDCYAVWEESYAFADASWEYIAQMSESGRASEAFAIGDKKTIKIGSYSVTLVIADFNYDVLASDTTKTAGMTIISDTAYGSTITNTKLSSGNTYANATNNLKTKITEIHDNMPSDLKSFIKPVKKRTVGNNYTYDSTLSVWPLSCSEAIDGDTQDDSIQHRPYGIFATPSLLDSSWEGTSTTNGVWTRTVTGAASGYWGCLYTTTSRTKMYRYHGPYGNKAKVKFGFCI